MHLVKKEVILVENFFYDFTEGVLNKAFLDQDNKMFLCWYGNFNKTLKILELPVILEKMKKRLDYLEKNPGSSTNYCPNEKEQIKIKSAISILNEIENLLKS